MDEPFLTLMNAAYAGDLDRFQALLAATPDLANRRSSCSHPTLLQFVAVEGGLGRVPGAGRFAATLIESGAPLAEPLVAAASVNARDLVDQLLAAGAPVEAGHPWTPLEEALYWGYQPLAHHLRDTYGAAVLSLRTAAGLGDIERVGSLFREDGTPAESAGPVRFPWGVPEVQGLQDVLDQAFVIAIKNRQTAAAGLLLRRGADINARPPGIHEGGGALHLAALSGDEETVDWLLARGADPDLTDGEHQATAAGWARHGGHEALAARLEAAQG